ncbi:MAG: anthranilate synthase component I [Candidatus Marinimicrobia bacterium]|nr:anthranilate synthase component I [Candidatus Neomarinimicrobiota bacterium]
MDFEQFASLAGKYTAIPVYRKVLADLLTPVSAYMRLAEVFRPTVLLESVEGGQQFTRYSYICLEPRLRLTHANGETFLEDQAGRHKTGDPMLTTMKKVLAEYHVPELEEVPSFCGGWVGYLGYETVTWTEDIPVYPAGETDIPDAMFLLFETVMAFDHLKQEIIICHTTRIDRDRPLEEQYKEALAVVDRVGENLHTGIDYQTPNKTAASELTANMTKGQFMEAVEKAREYIFAGDVFQLVLSLRFQRVSTVKPLTLYRALRNINPSPYLFCLQLEDFAIIGASPELLVKVEDNMMIIRPIAGTRPRGKNRAEDGRLAEELLADDKERAEHLMLVDLGRNDVGRVSRLGSVEVHKFMTVEKFSHVMHIVSDIRGQLEKDKDIFDALLSGFPAGTLTGAPKIRAMELINELEPDRRGIYSGALGYADFHGNLNTCVVIRTLLQQDDVISFQSGAGIVADSDPETEYDESFNKAMAIMRAIDFAEGGLQ